MADHTEGGEFDVRSLRDEIRGHMAATYGPDGDRSASRLRVLTGTELFEMDASPLPWLINGQIPRGRQGTIFGKPGDGKSFTARHWTVSLAANVSTFGSFDVVAPGPVLWITNEEDVSELRLGFSMVAAGAGADIDVVKPNIHVAALRGADFTLASEADQRWLEETAARIMPAMTVLDSASSVSGIDLKDDQAAGKLFRWGARFTSTMDTTLLWIAHDRKTRSDDVRGDAGLDDLFGSRSVSAQLDFAYRLTRSGDDRLLRCVKMRGAKEPEDVTLELHIEADRTHAMRCGTDMSRMSRDSALLDAVHHALLGHAGCTMSELRDMVAKSLKRRGPDVGDSLKVLLQQRVIENRGTAYRFELFWRGMEHVPHVPTCPDTRGPDHVPMSAPLKGADWDTGHEEAA